MVSAMTMAVLMVVAVTILPESAHGALHQTSLEPFLNDAGT